jgi:hypothetical protein
MITPRILQHSPAFPTAPYNNRAIWLLAWDLNKMGRWPVQPPNVWPRSDVPIIRGSSEGLGEAAQLEQEQPAEEFEEMNSSRFDG